MSGIFKNLEDCLQVGRIARRVEIIGFFRRRGFGHHQYPDFPRVDIARWQQIIIFINIGTGELRAFYLLGYFHRDTPH